MKNEKTKLLPYDLQFFAEDNDSSNDQGGEKGNEDQNSNDNSGEKTFTQSEVNSMMAKEKNEGKRSILKSLGFKNEDEAKKSIEEYAKYLESKKTREEKDKELIDNANREKDEALQRAIKAESKLACYALGISSEYVDDVLAIASSKVTDEKSLDDVLNEMKNDEKYSNFFSAQEKKEKGTGSNAGHSSNNHANDDDYGKRLAEKANANVSAKSSFFND